MSDDRRFDVGDVVCLLSGGPSMTICAFRSENPQAEIPCPCALCMWFDFGGLHEKWVPLEVLVHYTPPPN